VLPGHVWATLSFYGAKVTGIAKVRRVYHRDGVTPVFEYHVKLYDRYDRSIKEKSQGMLTGKSFVVEEYCLFASRLEALTSRKKETTYKQTRKGWNQGEWVPKKLR